MMTKAELTAVEDFLEAPWGTQEMHEALDEVIRMADVNREAVDSKDQARKRSRASRRDRVIP